MSKKGKVNRSEPVSEEHKNFKEEIGTETDESVQAELDELENKIAAKPAPVKTVEEPVEETVEKVEEPVEEIPEEFREKTPAQLVEMYQNLRLVKDKQITELGDLRKGKKEAEDAVEMAKKYELEKVAKSIVPKMKKWTNEEKQNWLAKLGQDPQSTLTEFVVELMKPSLTTTADTRNKQAVAELKEKYKDAIVPYNENEVAKILFNYRSSDNRSLFDEHKSGAFEAAYSIYRDKNFDGFAEKRLETKANQAKEEAKIEAEKRKGAFVEPAGPASPKNRGKIVNLKDKIEGMEDPEKALEVLEKLLPEEINK